MVNYKFTDPDIRPMPQLKVGDICYVTCPWSIGRNYSHISKCEVRKIEVKWHEPIVICDNVVNVGHWTINYYLRTDIDSPGLKSTPRCAYYLGDDGSEPDMFLTPKEVMDVNIEKFKRMVIETANSMRKTMKQLGYTEEKQRNLLPN